MKGLRKRKNKVKCVDIDESVKKKEGKWDEGREE